MTGVRGLAGPVGLLGDGTGDRKGGVEGHRQWMERKRRYVERRVTVRE